MVAAWSYRFPSLYPMGARRLAVLVGSHGRPDSHVGGGIGSPLQHPRPSPPARLVRRLSQHHRCARYREGQTQSWLGIWQPAAPETTEIGRKKSSAHSFVAWACLGLLMGLLMLTYAQWSEWTQGRRNLFPTCVSRSFSLSLSLLLSEFPGTAFSFC